MAHKHHIFVGLLWGVVWGIGATMFVPLPWILPVLVAIGLVVVMWASIATTAQIGNFTRWWIALAVLVGLAIGGARGLSTIQWLASPEVLVGQDIAFVGVVASEPVATARGVRMVVTLRSCASNAINCAGMRTLVTAPSYSEVRLRDGIAGRCVFSEPENFSDDFDYQMYLAKNGVRTICAISDMELTPLTTHVDKWYARLMQVRYAMEEHIATSVAAPASALASGLLFGGDRRLSDEVAEDFRRTGLTHIVAVSGFNVTVIAQFVVILGIVLGLWRAQAVWLAIAAVFGFVAMIGFPAPAVRAGIMGMVVLLAMRAGRVGSASGAVLLAATAMILVNPMILRYDVGFQLSVLATLGIILLYPLFERWFLRRGEMKFLLEIFFLTLSAQIFVVPIIAYYFGTVSIISLLANLLVLPVIPIAMALAFGVAMIGFVSSAAAVALGGALYWLLAWVFIVVDLLAALPWASKNVTMTVWLLLAFYFILFISIAIMRRYLRKCRCSD